MALIYLYHYKFLLSFIGKHINCLAWHGRAGGMFNLRVLTRPEHQTRLIGASEKVSWLPRGFSLVTWAMLLLTGRIIQLAPTVPNSLLFALFFEMMAPQLKRLTN